MRLNHRHPALVIGALGLLLSAGCASVVRPPDVQPQINLPSGWSSGDSTPVDGEVLSTWWLAFDDPMLTSLVERAVVNNLDVRAAVSRVRQARANLDVATGSLRPAVDAGGGVSVSGTGEGRVADLYRAGFDANWELDVFGGIRAGVDASAATVGAREADLQSVLVSLVAEVGSVYVDVRSLQNRLTIARANLASQEEAYDLARFRATAGLVSALDVEQARSNLEGTRAQVPSLEASLAITMHSLELLLGESPGRLSAELAAVAPVPVAPLSIALGVPAETLERRPDVRSAERALAAQTAAVGSVQAQLYPRFGLVGSIGLDALDVVKLIASSALGWNVAPSVTWPVFDRGQIRRSVDVQTELQEQALVAYEQTLLAALAEVEDALVSLGQEQVRREHLAEAVDAASQASTLAENLYAAGLRDFRDVLDAQRSRLVFEDQLALSDATISTEIIRLFKALGGGWSALPPLETTDGSGQVASAGP